MAFRRRRPNSALVGSAAVLDATGPSATVNFGYRSWQAEAWAMFDTLGEYRQGVTWLGNVLSRARLVPALAPVNPGDEPTILDPDTNDPAVELVEEIGGGIGGQSELLRSAAVHLTIAGEGHYVGQSADEEVAWKFYSHDELRRRSGAIEVQVDDQAWRALPPDSVVVRVWRSHDRYHWQADSSSRAALPIMRRLELLNRKIDAQLQSRLAANGLYWIPAEMEFPVKEEYADAEDPFTAELMDVGTQAIKTPGSAAAAFPMIARAPAEYIDKVRWDKWSGDLESELLANREFEIKRLATALDVPPEILLGMAGLNHWGAWQVEESALKTTVTSLLELVCWSLTTGYLRPAMRAVRDRQVGAIYNADEEEIDLEADRLVWYDLSELAVRPDRSQDAMALGEALVIKNQARLREMGFDEADLLLDDAELRTNIGKILVRNASTAPMGLELLGIDVVAQPLGRGEIIQVPDDGETPTAGEGELPANDTDQAAPATNGDQPAPPLPVP